MAIALAKQTTQPRTGDTCTRSDATVAAWSPPGRFARPLSGNGCCRNPLGHTQLHHSFRFPAGRYPRTTLRTTCPEGNVHGEACKGWCSGWGCGLGSGRQRGARAEAARRPWPAMRGNRRVGGGRPEPHRAPPKAPECTKRCISWTSKQGGNQPTPPPLSRSRNSPRVRATPRWCMCRRGGCGLQVVALAARATIPSPPSATADTKGIPAAAPSGVPPKDGLSCRDLPQGSLGS